jgi:hypothetical protein
MTLRRIPILILAFALGGFAGCDRPEEIRVYTVDKPAPVELPPGNQAEMHSAGPTDVAKASGPMEILGAIMPHGEIVWFFKIMGSPDAMLAAKQDFAVFIRSVKLGKKGPTWDLPEGWHELPGSQIRIATIRIDNDVSPLEMSVIPMPAVGGEEGFDKQLLDNLNRWRDQVGLAAISAEQLADSKEIIELQDGALWVADFIGKSKEGDPMAGPSTTKPASPREKSPTGSAVLPFDCQVPAEWTAGKPGQFQVAVFDVRDGDRAAKITVSSAGGDLTANINRWREQVGLSIASAAEIARDAKKLTIDGNEGTYVGLVGPESANPRKTILGVIVTAQGTQWFLKLTGDAELAAKEKTRFEDFVQSIKFR